jgi:Sulfatase
MERPLPRQILLLAAIAMGVSSTVFLDGLTLLASPTHMFVYHLSGRPSLIFFAVIADTLVFSAICFAALLFVQQRTTLHRAVWSLLICLYPWIFIRNLYIILGLPFSRAKSDTIFALCAVVFLALVFGRTRQVDHAFSNLERFAKVLLAGTGIAGALALLQITVYAFQARHLNDQVVTDTIAHPANATPHGRVIWILLDELAYRQLYDHRLSGLQLPAFDQLRAQSTVFTNVQPAGIRTEIVLPALMTGDPVDRVESNAEGGLTIHDAHGWHSFDQRNTVFADADAMGYQSSVVGWFNPYCRILPKVLDSCYWVNHSIHDGFSTDGGTLLNLLYPVRLVAQKLPSFLGLRKGLAPVDVEDGKEHIRDFVDLDHAADAALADSRNNFLLLHMPVPHPNGIWDRRTGQFAVDHSCYVDNLVLADSYLAHVRSLLEASGQWDSTTIVIMGDHAWRTQLLWKDSPAWSRDDQIASDGGRFDPRPAYIVKLPNQHSPATVAASFSAMRTRPLLDQLLESRFNNPAQLEQWVAGASASAPVAAQPHKGDHS